MLDRFLLTLAHIFKFLNLPHIFKYGLFMWLKKKQISVRSGIAISNIDVNLNLGDFIEYWTFMDGLYEKDWIIKAKELVKGKVLIDVGANIGVYPLSLFKEAKYIYAFEPEKENFTKLVHNLEINSITNILALRKAIFSSNRRGVKLHISNDDKGWHSLLINYSGGMQKVDTITLDYFIFKKRINNIGLIKIDVEGAELEVLKGSPKTLKKIHPPILVEFNRPRSELSGHNLIDIYNLIMKNDYLAFKLVNDNLVLLKNSDVPRIYNENILFTHK